MLPGLSAFLAYQQAAAMGPGNQGNLDSPTGHCRHPAQEKTSNIMTKHKAELGQFMTPANMANFMA